MSDFLIKAKKIEENTVNSLNSELSSINSLTEKITDWIVNTGTNIIAALLIFIIGHFAIKLIRKLINKLLSNNKIDVSIKGFVSSLVNITLNVLLVIAIIDKLGIETTSFAALLASAGVAIGMAFSGNLQNFAGGLIILLLKPYKIGDYIECQNEAGTVKEIQIFHTILNTIDNKVVYIPNGALSSGTIKNHNREDFRRISWNFAVEYGEDFNKVKKVVRNIISKDDKIMDTPEPLIVIQSLDDSSVNILVRATAKSADYWDVYWDFTARVYETFNNEGINFPFPQITVHNAKDN